jgi:hypothetical protein
MGVLWVFSTSEERLGKACFGLVGLKRRHAKSFFHKGRKYFQSLGLFAPQYRKLGFGNTSDGLYLSVAQSLTN